MKTFREVLKELWLDGSMDSESNQNTMGEDVDEALTALAEIVKGMKKGRKICFGEDCTSEKVKTYNKTLSDVVSKIREGVKA